MPWQESEKIENEEWGLGEEGRKKPVYYVYKEKDDFSNEKLPLLY